MPFSLLIIAGPSTILTSATIESGTCIGPDPAPAEAGGFMPPACIPPPAGSPPIPAPDMEAALTSRFFTSCSSWRNARA